MKFPEMLLTNSFHYNNPINSIGSLVTLTKIQLHSHEHVQSRLKTKETEPCIQLKISC